MMDYEKIYQTVDALLRIVGVYQDGVEQPARLLMRHLLTAQTMFDVMDETERNTIAKFQKKLRNIFDSKCNLKERKRKQKKENTSPAPLPKEKENKEKDEKTRSLNARETSEKDFFVEARKEAFRGECLKYVDQYDTDQLTIFFNYWSEVSGKRGLMRWELEKTWQTENRLKVWMKRGYTATDTAAKMRLEQAKGKDAQQESAARQQQVAAEVRRQQEAAEARKTEEMKANRQSIDDYIRQNPDSMMAKMYRENHKK